MGVVVGKLAIVGQGLIGSSITRAAFAARAAREVVVTDASAKVRRRVTELGIGEARVVETAADAAAGADLVVICVPVGRIVAVARDIAGALKDGAVVCDVGSVKAEVAAGMRAALPAAVHLVPAHPLAGTEFSGPDAGQANLFSSRWCILTPPERTSAEAVAAARAFWEALGAQVAIMSPLLHDRVLSVTSHLPHLIAFSIFHTALRMEEEFASEVIKFSAGGFRDFTRIASSNPGMWRDIFLSNREPVLETLARFRDDIETFARAIEAGDGERLEALLSTSRLTRRKIIEKEHISLQPAREEALPPLISPYASDD